MILWLERVSAFIVKFLNKLLLCLGYHLWESNPAISKALLLLAVAFISEPWHDKETEELRAMVIDRDANKYQKYWWRQKYSCIMVVDDQYQPQQNLLSTIPIIVPTLPTVPTAIEPHTAVIWLLLRLSSMFPWPWHWPLMRFLAWRELFPKLKEGEGKTLATVLLKIPSSAAWKSALSWELWWSVVNKEVRFISFPNSTHLRFSTIFFTFSVGVKP